MSETSHHLEVDRAIGASRETDVMTSRDITQRK
jgi:hypothetical protein